MFHLGRLVALPTNIRQGWKGLLGTNTLAYYENSLNTSVKSFITLGPGLKGRCHALFSRRTEGHHVARVQPGG